MPQPWLRIGPKQLVLSSVVLLAVYLIIAAKLF